MDSLPPFLANETSLFNVYSVRCFYDSDYFLPLPPGHPFPMEKFPEAKALLEGDPRIELAAIDLVTTAVLERVHDSRYLARVSFDAETEGDNGGLSRYDRNRLGLPAHPHLLARSTLETSGTVWAAEAALVEGMAANLAGGTHHAFPDRGLGFCVLNDIAVAIRHLEAACGAGSTGRQYLIVDTDAHQGNGTHFIFRHDSRVFTYSIHVGPNYPAKKEPGDLDVPLPRYVDGKQYLTALEKSLPGVFERLEPDLVFWISGADNHKDDRFGQMALTTAEMATRDQFVLSLCRDYAAPVVVLYGGGYNRLPGMTAALHAQTIQIAARFS